MHPKDTCRQFREKDGIIMPPFSAGPPYPALVQRTCHPGVIAALVAFAVAAMVKPSVGDLVEIEPNDEIGAPQLISLDSALSTTVNGSLAGGEGDQVDRFTFTDVNRSDNEYYIGVLRSSTDTMLGGFQDGQLVRTVDNGSRGERIHGRVPDNGIVELGVTGFADNGVHDFEADVQDHRVSGDYSLEFSLVAPITPAVQPYDSGSVRLMEQFDLDGISFDSRSGNYFALRLKSGLWDVTQIDSQGHVVSFISGDELEDSLSLAQGITLSPSGNLLISGLDSVIEVTTDGELVQDGIGFLTDDRVHGLAYDTETSQLFGLEANRFVIQEYDASGSKQGAIDFSKVLIEELDSSRGLGIDPETGNFWVAGENGPESRSAVVQLSRSGDVLSVLDLEATFGISNAAPEGVTFNTDTNELVIAFDNPSQAGQDGNLIGFLQLPRLAGDFDVNAELNATDLDLMADEMRAGLNHQGYDVNSDGVANLEDRRYWVHDLANTYFGDSDLNGVFDTEDLVSVFSAGKFELDGKTSWSEGDWNGDRRFDSGDLVIAFQDGGFETGRRPEVVPEPSSAVMLTLGVIGYALRGKRLDLRTI